MNFKIALSLTAINQTAFMSFIIGICGGSGSGKTSFIKDIRKIFSPNQVCIISQDDYYKPRDQQKSDHKGVKNFDLPESIDIQSYLEDISRIKQGLTIERMEYTYNNQNTTPNRLTIIPAPIVVLEGLFVFSEPKLWDLLDIKIYIEAEETSQLIRRIKRDQLERNYPLEDVLYRYEHHVKPSLEKYIIPFKSKVDLIINNNHSYSTGIEILTSYIEYKLKTISIIENSNLL